MALRSRTLVCSALAALLMSVGLAGAVSASVNAADGGNWPVHTWSADKQGAEPDQTPLPDSQYGSEVPSLRSANSLTYQRPDGSFVSVVGQTRINYLAGKDDWEPIDSTLTSDGNGGWTNKANSFSIHVPANISAGVGVTSGDGSVSFKLQGADASAQVSGDEADFASALPGVSVDYTSGPERMKEDLVLASASAPASYAFPLTLSVGLSASRDESGGISVTDGSGALVFSIPAPIATDAGGATGAARYALAMVQGAPVLTLSLDSVWLADSSRQWPVTADPTLMTGLTTLGSNPECVIRDGSFANISDCSDPLEKVGFDGTNIYREVSFWNLSSVPADAIVFNAKLTLSQTLGSSGALEVHPLTQSFTSSATWNKYDGSNGWTTAGGDYGATAATTTISGSGLQDWDVTSLVAGWVNGTVPNDGMLMKASSETSNNLIEFTSGIGSGTRPSMTVTWQYRLGSERQFTFDQQQLFDRFDVGVNVANDNLLAHAHIFSLAGTGLPLNLDLYFNTLAKAQGSSGIFGDGWTSTFEPAILPGLVADGSLILRGETGYEVKFQKSGGNYTAPTGIDATLTTGSSPCNYQLVWDKTQETWCLNSSGQIATETDQNGNAVAFTYSSGDLSTITDDKGATIKLTYNFAGGQVTQIDDNYPGGRIYQFGYTGSLLTSITDPDSEVTSLTYGGPGSRLEEITSPAAFVANVTDIYYGSNDRVDEVDRMLNPGVNLTAAITQYGFSATSSPCPSSSADLMQQTLNKNTVQDPNGNTTTYCMDREGRNVQKIDARGKAYVYTFDSDPTTHADGDSNLIQTDLPNGQSSTGTFNSNTDPTSTTAAASTLHGNGPLTTLSYGISSGPNMHYPTGMVNPQGNSWNYAYDGSGNLCAKSEGTTSSTLTCAGGSGQGANPVFFTYNSGSPNGGTVATATDGDGNVTDYCYKSSGYVSGVCTGTPGGDLTGIKYPAPLGAVNLTYDSEHRVSTVTDGNGKVTTYTYDNEDRVKEIDYNGGATCSSLCVTSSYDGDGNLVSQGGTSAGSTTYSYDHLDRLIGEAPSGSSQTPTYGYDNASNLTGYSDGGGSTSYTYDELNRPTTMTLPNTQQITFGYDDDGVGNTNQDGNQTSINYPNGVSIYKHYDLADRLTAIVNMKSASNSVYAAFCYTYDNTSISPGTADANLRKTVSEYDNVLSNVTDCPSQSTLPAPPPSPPPATSITTYYYGSSYGSMDPDVDRLIEASTTGVTSDYKYYYDPAGNMLQKHDSTAMSPNTFYAYNGANELCQEASSTILTCGSPNYSYDYNGNELTSPRLTGLAYNTANQTSSITPVSTAINMGYRGAGQTDRATAGSDKFVTTALGLASRDDGSSNFTYFLRDPAGTPLVEETGTYAYYLYDGLGSVVGLTDTSGNLITAGTSPSPVFSLYHYDPYGNLTGTAVQAGYPYNPFTYAGAFNYQTDPATGLVQIGARYYDPQTGRWTQADPLADPLDTHGANKYAYADDDPMNFIDPTGLTGDPGWVGPTCVGLSGSDLRSCAYGSWQADTYCLYWPDDEVCQAIPGFSGSDCLKGAIKGGALGYSGQVINAFFREIVLKLNWLTLSVSVIGGCIFSG